MTRSNNGIKKRGDSGRRDAVEVDIETIAAHEAGHAVMRWLVGWPATELTCSSAGGFCAGTGRAVNPKECLLVTVAGFSVETGYGIEPPILTKCRGDDFDEARALAEKISWLYGASSTAESVDETVLRYFARAAEMLCPHAELVDYFARRLETEGRLSARSVAAMCREHERRTGLREALKVSPRY